MKPVVLMLPGGGARGLCFVGALKVLARSDVPIKRIIGTSTSIGAIIGGAYEPPPGRGGDLARPYRP